MSRNICLTAVEGQTGFLVAELLMKESKFSSQVDSLTGLTMNPSAPKIKELESLGVNVVTHKPGRERAVITTLKQTGCDTICLIPPTRLDKCEITLELVHAAKKAGVPSVLLISSAGCDYADPVRQPRLRQFIDIETAMLSTKGDTGTATGHSVCIIRAGFYAENLLLYSEQAKVESVLPLPIGESNKFAPVALGNVPHLAAHVLAGKDRTRRKRKFADRSSVPVYLGPLLYAGDELPEAASKAIGATLDFENIPISEAKRILSVQSESDKLEQEYILDYYSLVREGKTNYVATTAFQFVTGVQATEPDEFFKLYAAELRPRKKVKA
ncbi:hypothetical protein B0T26DRAFT_669954 [Lasiosphaeria miniovina]|uniref:NmrA-like domain-containing protein n=1 Tax=Lasiosphaeria miniovina TaxID=1954250 RepID=A0AA40EDL4_9PEZI|nr:uncharacterized protein B0T26DRAFT_669954 [Lasiosphaeria miniovina]KAK0733551.1 hypothetical protein B0T26DRAFT_669954 [Lasiosphaeria miniovina]